MRAKAGEFIDHAADILDLADDRVGALIEDGPVVLIDLLAVAALEALGRKLDRRQRVLDLMGDAAGDVRPGGRALGDDEIGDVVEGDDVGFLGVVRIPRASPARSASAPCRRA